MASIVRITSVFSTDGRQSYISENPPPSSMVWSSAKVFIGQFLPSFSAIGHTSHVRKFGIKEVISRFGKNKFAHPSLRRIVDLLDAIASLFSGVARPHDLPSRFPIATPRFSVARLS